MTRRPPKSTLFPYTTFPDLRDAVAARATLDAAVAVAGPLMGRATAREIGRAHVLTPVAAITLSASFFFNDTAPTEIYPLSLHDVPRSPGCRRSARFPRRCRRSRGPADGTRYSP